MKILKILFYVILSLIVIFLLVGFMHPTVSYGHEINVDKPVKEAWAVTQDDSKYNQWLDGFQSIELISGENGAVGSKYKVIVNPGDGQDDFEMIETVVSLKEFDHVTLNFDSDMMDFEQTISVSGSGNKASVKTESKVRGKNIIMRSMFAVMERLTGSFTTQEVKNIEALKAVIEKNSTDYYPIKNTTE